MPAATQAQANSKTSTEVLRRRFLERSAADLILLLAYPDGVSRDELGFIVHRLAGAAGMFGYPALSAAAAELELALAARASDVLLPTRPLAVALAALLSE